MSKHDDMRRLRELVASTLMQTGPNVFGSAAWFRARATEMATLVGPMLTELEMLRAATTRIVDHSDPDVCDHNREIDPDTGECGDCGTVLP